MPDRGTTGGRGRPPDRGTGEPPVVQGRRLAYPVTVTSAAAAGAVFAAPARGAAEVLAETGLRPVSRAGRTPAALFVARYRDHPGNVLGSYDEVGLALLVRAPDGVPRPFVFQMPVTAEFTRDAGRRLWGLPKWTARIDARAGRHGGRAVVSTDGGRIAEMRFDARLGLPVPSVPWAVRTHLLCLLDGVPCTVPVRLRGSGVRVTALPGRARVIPGSGHPFADQLRTLGLPGAPVLLTFGAEHVSGEIADARPVFRPV